MYMLLTSSCDQRGILKLFLYERRVLTLPRATWLLFGNKDGPHRYTDRAQLLPKRFSRRIQAEDQGQCGCSGSEAGTQREGKGWTEGSEGLSSNLASFAQGLCGLWYVTLCATALPPQGKLWLRMAPTGITWGANLNPVKCSAQPHPQPVSTWHLGSHLHFFSFADPVVPRFLW